MKTDGEMLILAAKAAGINIAAQGNEVAPAHFDGEGLYKYSHGGFVTFKWLPLTDDGDALRLAVKLNLLFNPDVAHGISVAGFLDGADPYAATRRAIVRAAAAIGEAM